MGDVLAFRPKDEKAKRARPTADAAPAQVVFFTGVRYERLPEFAIPGGLPDGSGSPDGTGPRKRRA